MPNEASERPATDRVTRLLERAKARFGDPLTPAEETLFRAAASGEEARYGPWTDRGRDDLHRAALQAAAAQAGPAPPPAAGGSELGPEPDPQVQAMLEAVSPANAGQWPEDRALQADRIEWLCTDSEARGLVTHRGLRVIGARVEGDLDLDDAKVRFPLAFVACGFRGRLSLQHAHVPGLFLNGSHTRGIEADRLKVRGNVFLRGGFCAEGEVRLLGADIGGDLACDGGQFINPRREGEKEERPALNADGLKVGGHVFLRGGFGATGLVSFVSARVEGHFQWWGVLWAEEATLDLRSARVGTLWDEKESWPDPGRLHLHGLEYEEICHEAPLDAKARIEWVRRQPDYTTQPYEQLALVLGRQGLEDAAKDVQVAKNDDRLKALRARKVKPLTREWFELFTTRAWLRFLGATIGYGYRLRRVLVWLALFWLLGIVCFGLGYEGGVLVEVPGRAYEPFCPVVYSLDAFVQVVDLGQAEAWWPDAALGWGGWLLRVYAWVHILAGWAWTSLAVVGLTGLVRK